MDTFQIEQLWLILICGLIGAAIGAVIGAVGDIKKEYFEPPPKYRSIEDIRRATGRDDIGADLPIEKRGPPRVWDRMVRTRDGVTLGLIFGGLFGVGCLLAVHCSTDLPPHLNTG